MKYILVLIAATLLTGCPEAPPDERTTASEECALNYAVTVLDQVGEINNLDERESEKEACDAAFDAVHLADEGSGDRWYSYHRAAWDNPSKLMIEHCEEDLSVKADMLEDDQILRFRCIVSCDGHDPDDC